MSFLCHSKKYVLRFEKVFVTLSMTLQNEVLRQAKNLADQICTSRQMTSSASSKASTSASPFRIEVFLILTVIYFQQKDSQDFTTQWARRGLSQKCIFDGSSQICQELKAGHERSLKEAQSDNSDNIDYLDCACEVHYCNLNSGHFFHQHIPATVYHEPSTTN